MKELVAVGLGIVWYAGFVWTVRNILGPHILSKFADDTPEYYMIFIGFIFCSLWPITGTIYFIMKLMKKPT